MNIKIENLSYEAWDEVYSILNEKRKFIKKPNRKTTGLTIKKKNNITYIICFLVALLIILLIRFLKHTNIIIDIVIGTLILLIILSKLLNNYIIYKYIKRDINRRINTPYKMTSLKINKDGVIIVKSRKHIVTLLWNEISHILINQYSIVFLSKGIDKVSIVVPIKIKKRVLDKLKKEDKLNLVVDNTNLYIENKNKKLNIKEIISKLKKTK